MPARDHGQRHRGGEQGIPLVEASQIGDVLAVHLMHYQADYREGSDYSEKIAA